jgi:hypothetical protein
MTKPRCARELRFGRAFFAPTRLRRDREIAFRWYSVRPILQIRSHLENENATVDRADHDGASFLGRWASPNDSRARRPTDSSFLRLFGFLVHDAFGNFGQCVVRSAFSSSVSWSKSSASSSPRWEAPGADGCRSTADFVMLHLLRGRR